MTNALPAAVPPRSDPAHDGPSGPVDRGLPGRLVRSIGYDAALVPVSLLVVSRCVLGQPDGVRRAWGRLLRLRQAAEPVVSRQPGKAKSLGHGVLSLLLGLLAWFLLFMLVMAVIRGIFYGMVTDGPYGPGTWGGPTKAGAWAVHAAVSIPMLVVLPLLLHGLAILHTALVRRLCGSRAGRWVLPATIAILGAGGLLFYSWTQQI